MFVVYDQQTIHVYRTCETAPGASRSCTVANKKLRQAGKPERYGWTSEKDFNDNLNTMTTTYNMLDPERRPIPIRRADKGGCCDPATETYHSS